MEQLGLFHHIGLACRFLSDEYSQLSALGYTAESEPIADPIQKVFVQFFSGGGPRIELVQPASEASPVHGWLDRGTKLYHLAYEVADLEGAIRQLKEVRFRLIAEPLPAVAFDMRRIVFVMSPTLNLVELIEAKK